MTPRSILDGALSREPLDGHDGKSGAALERVVLADGRRVVVKRLDPSTDLMMRLTRDPVGREYALWSSGCLDLLPAGVGHAVLDGWAEDVGSTLVLRDLASSVLSWRDRLDRERWLLVVRSVAALHRAGLQRTAHDSALASLEDQIGLFGPRRARSLAAERELMELVARGWEHFRRIVPGDVAEVVPALADDPTPLATALRARPSTLVHGDLSTVNLAIEGDTVVLLDWGLSAVGPGALDVTRFIAGCASVVDVSREQMIADYRDAAGAAYDETAMQLALLAALVWLGWNKALDAAEHPDPWMRRQETDDLAWWVDRGRATLDAGLL
jgi:hypothetical protein